MKSIFDINGFIAQSLGFSNGLWVLIGAVLFALLCLCFILAVRGGRVKGRAMFIETGWTALWYFGLLGLSLFTYWPFGEKKALWSPSQPALVWCIAAVVVIVLYFFYFRKRKKQAADKVSATAIRRSAAGSGAAKYCYALLFAGMLVSSIVCAMRASFLSDPLADLVSAGLSHRAGLCGFDDPACPGLYAICLYAGPGDDSALSFGHPATGSPRLYQALIHIAYVRGYPTL